MKCFFCSRSMTSGDTLFRINPKGQKAVWACKEHRDQTDAPRDAVVSEIVKAIQGGKP